MVLDGIGSNRVIVFMSSHCMALRDSGFEGATT